MTKGFAMLFRTVAMIAVIFCSLKLPATPQPKIPHELKDFYQKLEQRIDSLEQDLFGPGHQEQSLAHKFLISLINQQLTLQSNIKNKNKEVILTPNLKDKIKSLLKSKQDSQITLDLLSNLLKDSSSEFSDEEKIKLAALILVHGEKNLNGITEQESAIENVIKKYETDPILKTEVKPEQKGLDRLTSLISKALLEPEFLDTLLNPIKEQVFDSEKQTFSSLNPLTPVPNFKDTMTNLQSFRGQTQVPDSSSINLGNHPVSPENGSGTLAPRSSAMGALGGIPLGSVTPTPDVQDTPELKACVDYIRQKRFNVELGLPGALCASTPIARDPNQTFKSFRKNISGRCEVDLASATHCTAGMGDLRGRPITAKIGGENIRAQIIKGGSVEPIHGSPVQDGNPDLMVLKVELPCAQALKLEIARIPAPEEVNELTRKESLPLVLQQNSSVNVSQQGGNQATIAGTGSFERQINGGLGNFIRFNTKSSFNKSSGYDVGRLSSSPGIVLDSNRIKSGDSGGAAMTCKFEDDKKVKEILYVGAISHITVRGDYDEGKEGGIASGQSLLSLSRSAWGDERLANNRGSVLLNNRLNHD